MAEMLRCPITELPCQADCTNPPKPACEFLVEQISVDIQREGPGFQAGLYISATAKIFKIPASLLAERIREILEPRRASDLIPDDLDLSGLT